ncbi:hypothetical protein M124_1032 [Bacteroides fragilis str. 3988T(B)14]|uniref:Uncharacterized protein n=1 Tax=Bacteroides fragilis str. 3988T(B)14 TaxID=1339315 RepID=A0A015W424_BACFG|nr:hypothetical protein M124_1032 [Bacteroides fragilis str. 3988T(B)14]
MRYNTYIENTENQHIEVPGTFNVIVKTRFVPFKRAKR